MAHTTHDEAHRDNAMTPEDERLIWNLYNRAVLRTYKPWSDARGATWLPRSEAAHADYAVAKARQNLSRCAKTEGREGNV